MEKIDVTPIEIRDFAQSLGWTLVREALKDGLFVLNSPQKDGTQLVFTKEIDEPKYEEMAAIAINRLCEFYRMAYSRLIEEIREVNDDVINLRYFSSRKFVNSLSFEEAFDIIEGTRQMLLSAASSVVHPSIYHPKLNRSEPQELIKKAKFRHTQEGSFILKIAIPFEKVLSSSSNMLFEDMDDRTVEKSFSRNTIELISSSSKEIIDSIEENSLKELYDIQANKENPTISFNFCDSLSKLFDKERELPFEINFNWSKASLLSVPLPNVPNKISFPFSYLGKLNELKEYFTPKKLEIEDTFIGTVEELNGDMGLDDRRSGEVVLNLLVGPDAIKTKVNLNADHYQIAIKAHEKGQAYVAVRGRLHRSPRVARLDNVTEFRLESLFN